MLTSYRYHFVVSYLGITVTVIFQTLNCINSVTRDNPKNIYNDVRILPLIQCLFSVRQRC